MIQMRVSDSALEAGGATPRKLVVHVRTEGRLGWNVGRDRMVVAEELAGVLRLQRDFRQYRICVLALVRVAVPRVLAGMVDEEVACKHGLQLFVEARRCDSEPLVEAIVEEDNHGLEPLLHSYSQEGNPAG